MTRTGINTLESQQLVCVRVCAFVYFHLIDTVTRSMTGST